MKRVLLALLSLPSIALAAGTGIGSLEVDEYCAFNSELLPHKLTTFASDADARAAVERIMRYTGLSPRFNIMASDVSNAVAVIRGKQRYILYSQFFMQQVKNATGNQWSEISILAHEIGHHLNNHTLEENGSRPDLELEADMFSGHVLYRMGASMADAVAAMNKVADENGSSTHPPRRTRVAAITNGWKRAQEQAGGAVPVTEFVREPTTPSPTNRASRTATPHAHNGRPHTHVLPGSGLNHEHGDGFKGTQVGDAPTAPAASEPASSGGGTDRLPNTIQLPNNLTLVKIPAGSFQMGSNNGYDNEKPVHKVTIPQPFWIGKTELTFAQYDAYAEAARQQKPGDEGWGRGNRPVINVSWNDAQGYVKWLSNNNAYGLQCRLPTEAEWEYAARGNSNTEYAWGDSIGRNRANCYDCGSQWDGKQTAPVASFPAAGFGLHDMHGNVWEWVQDRWHDNYQGAPLDGQAWESGGSAVRVLRGGSWFRTPDLLRSAFRNSLGPVDRYYFIGFRVVCSSPSER